MRNISMIVVHTSATRGDMNIGRSEIHRWHLDRGFSQIGYHFVIRRNGDIEMGRPLTLRGAHVRGFNTNSIGICMVGGLDDRGRPSNNYTVVQYESLRILLVGLASEYNVNPNAIMGHRDLSPDLNEDGEITEDEWMKACPCFDVTGWVENWWD